MRRMRRIMETGWERQALPRLRQQEQPMRKDYERSDNSVQSGMMSTTNAMGIDELFALPRHQLVERCLMWLVEFNDGKQLQLADPCQCPIHQWVVHNRKKCGQEFVPNIASCPFCGSPCCPQCLNHEVEQLSRVTGYISAVSGWGAAKKQELKDRQRVDL